MAELKFNDVDVEDPVVSASGSTGDGVFLISQGAGESQRLGLEVTVWHIAWTFKVTAPAVNAGATGPVADTVRLVLVLDKQCNGVTPIPLDVLEDATVKSFYNLANKDRFDVLMDRSYTLNYKAGGGNGTTSDWAAVATDDDFSLECAIPVTFKSDTGATDDLTGSNLVLVTISDKGVGGLGPSKFRILFTG